MTSSGEHMPEEPQEARGAPGSRDTGSDQPSGGPADRPSGAYQGDEAVPAHDEYGKSADTGSEKTEVPPSDAKPAVPPYEGRQTTADVGGGAGGGADKGARTGGATGPQVDSGYKSDAPGETAGGATASPAQEQPASQASESDRGDDTVDSPAHTPGTGRAERKL
ncbi:MAG: hypothetical protein JO152_08370 [Mycobacteriaceae bacterium]|nr:hypothetical protein [Mycobacteriaceae bacterium]